MQELCNKIICGDCIEVLGEVEEAFAKVLERPDGEAVLVVGKMERIQIWT